MADGIQITLHGDKDIVAALKDLREYLPKTLLRISVRKAAQMLAPLIALAAPKRTGKLARNIAVRTQYTDKTVRGRVTVNTMGKASDPQNAFYWRFLEQGWKAHGTGNFFKFAFIVETAKARETQAAQLVIDSVEQAIDRAEQKAKRAST